VPSGSGGTIQLLHDCQRTSALRFLVPWSDTRVFNVRETDEKNAGALKASEVAPRETDGAGLASAPVCGKAPERLGLFGPLKKPVGKAGVTSADVRRAEDAVARSQGFTVVRQGVRRLAVAVDRRRKGRALARGLRVRVRCSGGCRLRFRGLAGKSVVATGKQWRDAEGRRITRQIKFSAKARRSLARRRAFTLAVEVTAYDAGGRPLRAVQRVRLR
jgi:hypothetical protein